ncbi:expressed unknown protein [Seminavis robusta]|uniref:Uncharacterized protein n=1 Tax=Seminavis robusta TaxID=568900 RepID=A0A9N8HST1_9STRA|nr:expressed unknown protein [Seminavis robusta]|eukprot:Sro1768_g296370.1 n/a (130) ;mRNA; f:8182-8571
MPNRQRHNQIPAFICFRKDEEDVPDVVYVDPVFTPRAARTHSASVVLPVEGLPEAYTTRRSSHTGVVRPPTYGFASLRPGDTPLRRWQSNESSSSSSNKQQTLSSSPPCIPRRQKSFYTSNVAPSRKGV